MSISVNSSFKDVNNEIESLKTVKDISTDIKKRLSQSSNFDASSISGKSPLGIDAAKSLAKAEATNLLDKLLYIHIAPPSKEEIKRVRKLYKDLKTENYPIGEDLLSENIKPHDVKPSTTPGMSDALSTATDE